MFTINSAWAPRRFELATVWQWQLESIFTLKINYSTAPKENAHLVYEVSDYIQWTCISGNHSVAFYWLSTSLGVTYASENRHFATVTLPSPLSTELRAWGRFQVQVSVGARRLITTKMPGYVLRLPEGLQFSLFLFETHYFGPTCPSWPVVTVIRCQSRWIPQFDSPESVCALNASGQ